MVQQLSVEVSGKLTDDETPVRRNVDHASALITQPFEGIETVYDVLLYAARTHTTKPAFGTRPVLDVHEESKEVKGVTKKWSFFELGKYEYQSFVQVKEAADESAWGLYDLGVEKGAVWNIYAQTAANWQIMQHACSSLCITIATAYDTLGESGLTHALNEPECVGVFTNADLLQTLINVLPNVDSVKTVVYDGKPKPGALEKLKAAKEGLNIFSIDELRALGRARRDKEPKDDGGADPLKHRRPTKDDTSCIMYTSGSTGAPKGVVLTHANLIGSCGGVIQHKIGSHLKSDDTFLAFLPLSHILAYIVELTLFFLGCTIGYGRVRTLTDASVRKCQGDIKEFKPSIMIGVPAVWEQIRKGVLGKLAGAGAVTRMVFNLTLSLKRLGIAPLNFLLDRTVLSAIKQQTGGRLRLALSGGAALGKETQEFLNLSTVTLLQGYGLTESCGMCAILPPEYYQYSIAGTPVGSVEIKLLSVPSANYLSTNNPPQGEILIRGPSVTSGYFKRPDLNEDRTIFTEDGWFRTGDVGQWNSDGTLSIIDRIKNLVKLSGGEYIALERLESVYKGCAFISNICVYGTSDMRAPIAIVVPHESNLRHSLDGDLKERDMHDLCNEPSVQKKVLDECNKEGKKAGFKGMELLIGVVMSPEEWTPENELVTAAQKIQRKKISERFKDEIKRAVSSE